MTTITEDLGTAYRDARLRITDLVTAPEVDPSIRVPATPEWSVKDVIGHLAGVCSDILAGNLEGLATDPWTAAQVEARRATPLDELLEEWSSASAQIEPIISVFPGRSGPQFLSDVASHEHDLRGALEKPGGRDSAATLIGVNFTVGSWLHHAVKPAPLPSLLVDSGERQWRAGEDEPATTLRGNAFELLRVTTGRRSVGQIKGMDWSGDPEPYLSTFTWGPFRPAATDIEE